MRATPPPLTRYLALIICFGSGAATADEEPDYFKMTIEELGAIPVTTIATGTPKPIFQSAAVTTVITAEQIKSMGATELHEVLETVPGVHASVQASTGDYNYSVRGIRNATNSQILMLLNGTRITTPYRGTTMTGLEMPIEAIQRVEVIRGPGSALYGADAFAGVINIITKKTKDIGGTVLGARVGDHSTQSGWGQYGAQWAGWDVATSFQYQHTNGDNGRILKADAQSVFDRALGTHASHAPGALDTNYETLNGHLSLQRKHWDIGFWAFNSNGGNRAGSALALDPNGSADGENYLGDVRFSTEDWLDDWELMAHASYLQADFQARLQLFPDNAKLPLGSDGNITSSLRNSTLVLFPDGLNLNLGRIERIPSIELGSIYKGLDNHILRFSAGFRYEGLTTSDSRNFGLGIINDTKGVIDGTLTNVTGTRFAYSPNTHRTIWSLVAQDEWQIAADWHLTAGVRYDDYSDFGGTVNPRVALVWDINEQLTTKWLYGKAFRAPTFAEQGNQNNPVLVGNRNLNPETIHTVEWAFDYRPISSLRTGVNLYYYQIKDLIGVTNSTFNNSGNQDGYGSELEWNWKVFEQLNVMGNYAWQHSRNEQTHQQVAGVPVHHVYFATRWQFMPNWQLQPQINWVGGRINTIKANGTLDDYETIDITLRGTKLFGHLNVAASLRNIFDTNYSEPAANNIGQNLPMPGRSFYLEASVNF
ncbi:MAG: TonB-dependent receptor [Methylococcales bacterium]|nr:TonB-dependent receptor [Methylococcales bacterium]